MKPIVFLGPSLARSTAESVLDAEYREPAAAGDILSATRRKPAAIVLVDGYFVRVPAVWHKEILYALDQGIPVYGASSMGALRAAELHGFGMIGMGRIFERFRDGEFEDDDEVAVLHAPEAFGFRALSDAMVNLRDGLALAAAENVIDGAEQATLVACGKSLFYPSRTWARLAGAGVAGGLDPARMARLVEWVLERQPNSKRDDALAVLARVRDDLEAAYPPPAVAFTFERTVFWERLVDGVGGLAVTDEATAAATAWAKLRGPVTQWRAAMLRHLLRLEARRSGWQAEPDVMNQAVADLRRDHGLLEPKAFGAWLAANDLDLAALTRLVRDELLLTELVGVDARGIERALVEELKFNADWADLAVVAARQVAAARALGTPAPLPQDAGVKEADLLAWYTQTFRPIAGDVERHAQTLGFQNSTEFLVAVTRAYLVSPACDAPGPRSRTNDEPASKGAP